MVSLLQDAIRKGVLLVENMDTGVVDNLADGFAPGAFWETIEPKDEILEEGGLIVNEQQFHEPTLEDGEVMVVPKRNYDEKFDRVVFTGKAKLPVRNRNGKIIWSKEGKAKYKLVPCEETVPNIDFLQSHGIDFNSHPAVWFDAFLPKKQYDPKMISIDQITS